jgi:serine/threonine-protein kinase RsbW
MPSRTFSPYPMSVPAARGFVADVLDVLPEPVRETAGLLASELATNAIRHAATDDFEVSVQYQPGEDHLWVGVTDTGRGDPILRRPAPTEEHGRGLRLVGLLADRWGVRRRRGPRPGKTVWFELPIEGGAAQPAVPRTPEAAG